MDKPITTIKACILRALIIVYLLLSVSLSSQTTHQIQRGETLFQISRQYSVSVEDLRAWNNIGTENRIYPGQVLMVSEPRSGQHTVQTGDTLYSISRLYGVPLGELQSLNQLRQGAVIRPGMRIRIPGNAESITPNPATASPATSQPGRFSQPSPFGRWPLPVEPQVGQIYNTPVLQFRSPGNNVRSIQAGRVVYSGFQRGLGNLVLVEGGGRWVLGYANLELSRVQLGQNLSDDSVIGVAGTQPVHLLFFRDGQVLDPSNLSNMQ